MEKGISEIVGRGEAEGGVVDVYRALRGLLCSGCAAHIPEGELFTRRKLKGIGLSIMPECRKCAPFVIKPAAKEKSALLRALLEPSSPPADATARKGAPGRTTTTPEANANALEGEREAERNLKEAVSRRLGPALKRGRRGRE